MTNVISKLPLFMNAQRYDLDASLANANEIFGGLHEEASDLRLPELKSFIPKENGSVLLFTGNVIHN